MSRQAVSIIGLLVGMFTVTSVSAGLLGKNVILRYELGTKSSIDILHVSDTPEVSCMGGGSGNASVCQFLTAGNQSIDIDDLSINYTYTGSTASFDPVAPNGFRFQVENFGADIAFVLFPNIAGLDDSRLTFTADSFRIDMHGLTVDETQNAFSVAVSAVPVPAAIWLLAGGLAALGALRRRPHQPR